MLFSSFKGGGRPTNAEACLQLAQCQKGSVSDVMSQCICGLVT